MNTEIAILGLLNQKNMYGYEIMQALKEKTNGFFNMKFGSIYYLIKKSIDHGWIKIVNIEKNPGTPDRTIYQMLPAGKKHYKRILKKYFEKEMLYFNPDISIVMIDDYSEKELIQEKIEYVENKIDKLKEANQDNFYKKYIYRHLEAELKFLKSLLENIEK